MGQDSWEMSGIELSVGIWEQEHHDARQDVPVKTSKKTSKDMHRTSLSSPIPEDRQYLTRFAKGPNGEWVDVVKAGHTSTEYKAIGATGRKAISC